MLCDRNEGRVLVIEKLLSNIIFVSLNFFYRVRGMAFLGANILAVDGSLRLWAILLPP